MIFTPARKEQMKARVAMVGPTGAGKTWTALEWARILAGPQGTVAVIDTENRSAAYYADQYTFDHLSWEPPYDPVTLREMIRYADGTGPEPGGRDRIGRPYDVIVVDSLTHFWKGEGGTIDIADKAGKSQRGGGNSFAGWKEATPILRQLLDTIVWSPAHVIVTMRSAMEWVLVEKEGRDGRTVKAPEKVGMAPEMRKDIEYEFTVVCEMDQAHNLTVSKSRCSTIADVVAARGRSGEVAESFAAWLSEGTAPVKPDDDPWHREDLSARLKALPAALQTEAKDKLREMGVLLGRPQPVAVLAQVEELVAELEVAEPFGLDAALDEQSAQEPLL